MGRYNIIDHNTTSAITTPTKQNAAQTLVIDAFTQISRHRGARLRPR